MAEFAETAVLIAALEGDKDEVRRKLGKFLPGELRNLADAVDMMDNQIELERWGRMTPQEREDAMWNRLAP